MRSIGVLILYFVSRYYAFYLAIQAMLCMSPIITWNVMLKSKLLAILRGTEEFLENLIGILDDGGDKGLILSHLYCLIAWNRSLF